MNEKGNPGVSLRENASYYEDVVRLIARLDRRRRPETVLQCIQAAATLASRNHPGRFADGSVENIALEIGSELDRSVDCCQRSSLEVTAPGSKRRRVLHVATAVRTTGGHTRTILHWIRMDRESHHTLLLTGQGPYPVPAWLVDAIVENGGRLIELPNNDSLLAKASCLRKVARTSSDVVVLHHFPDDVVPTVAFAAAGGPPVAVLNHTDHLYWLGGTVADAVINLRKIGERLTEQRRFIGTNLLLPVPLADPLAGKDRASARAVARASLGIPQDQIALVSVGRVEKYVPTETHNFFTTAAEILDQAPEATLYLVGVSESDVREKYGQVPHKRLKLIGAVEDASPYQLAADIYLEGFPFGSQTALLESIFVGVPAIPAFAPCLDLVATSDDAVADVLRTPGSKAQYVAAALRLVRDREDRERRGAELRERIRSEHTDPGWLNRLKSVYADLSGTFHVAGHMPTSSKEESASDIALCAWQDDQIASAREASVKEFASSLMFATAYRARQSGDYVGAWQILKWAIRRWGASRQLLSSVGKLAPHWFWQSVTGSARQRAQILSCEW